MKKTILITGATDGIGQETAKILAAMGHNILLHGRNAQKLEILEKSLKVQPFGGHIESYLCDLSILEDVDKLAKAVAAHHKKLDVLINNAGVYKSPNPVNPQGMDIRFIVNAIAPYLLTKRLLPLLDKTSRVINLSSAAQSPVDLDALRGKRLLEDGAAYAQSKLLITMWTRHMALEHNEQGPIFVAINPGSLLGTNMVKEAFGMIGKDIMIGADILQYAAVSAEFETSSGKYYDNDSGQFATPHPDALNLQKTNDAVKAIENILADI